MTAPLTTVRAECHICGTKTKRPMREVLGGPQNRKCNGCRAILVLDVWHLEDGTGMNSVGDRVCSGCGKGFKGQAFKLKCFACYTANAGRFVNDSRFSK